MDNLIEQAVLRLEQLRTAGVAHESAQVDARQLPDRKSPTVRGSSPGSSRISIDLDALARAGFVIPGAPRTPLADQYRVIKRPLIANAMASGPAAVDGANLIMVTSALAGEGKSFTALNLALSMAAELDNTVLLVDADVAKPSLPGMLGLQAERGLIDVLDGRTDLGSVLLRTNVDKLSLLPSGGFHPRATELLASETMRRLLQDISQRYPERLVVFDSPPLLLTTEAAALARHMGQVVLVIHAETTLQVDVERALATIDSCPIRLAVLNQCRQAARDVYGYGQAYGSSGEGAAV